MTKRIFDIIASLMLMLILLPVMLGITILIAITMGRPVVFRQTRPGRGERPFTLYKFRSMKSSGEDDPRRKDDSQRMTKFGRFLRSSSLDELPELVNVLRGDMSLVGPRPLIIAYLPYYTEREKLRHSVRPGITGWAQINGRNRSSWDKRLADDVWYVEHQSLWLDIKILFCTILAVVRKSGIDVDPRAVMLDLDEERSATATTGGVTQ